MFPDSPFRKSIKNFLTAESLAPKMRLCEHCGSVIQHLFAAFTFGDGESWDIPLPFCPNCDQQRFLVA
jgi:ribosomal protein S27AE